MAIRTGRALLALCVMTASSAWAQPSQGPIVSGTVGAAAFDSTTSVSFTAAAGYRFNSVFGLGIELTSVPELELESPFSVDSSVFARPSIDIGDFDGSLTTFTANLRLEIPTTTRRVVPYASAGGGVASLEERFVISYSLPRPLAITPGIAALVETPGVISIFPPIPQPVAYSSTAMALTLGGGLSVLLTDRLAIDVDLRYIRLSGDSDRDLGRFGIGASYRF